MERARSDMLRAAGIDQRAAAENQDGVYAIADLQIRYRRPATLDDALVVKSRVIDVRAAATVIDKRIERGGELFTAAVVTAVLMSPEGRPKRTPRARAAGLSHWWETAGHGGGGGAEGGGE